MSNENTSLYSHFFSPFNFMDQPYGLLHIKDLIMIHPFAYWTAIFFILVSISLQFLKMTE